MLARQELERVAPSREHADQLLRQSRDHLDAVEAVDEIDAVGAYQLMYEAARKALTAVLANEGLRPTTAGGHRAAYEATLAQLHPPLGAILRPFDRMRRRRNDAAYPSPETPPFDTDHVQRDLPKVRQIVDLAGKVVDEMGPY